MNPWQRGQRISGSVLPADLHDRLQASILRTDHLEHPLVFRSSFEERGKILVIGILHDGCIAAAPVIDRFMDERGNSLCAIDTHGACYSPKYWTLIQCPSYSVDRPAGAQPRSLFHFNMVPSIAKLSEAYCGHANDHY